MDLTEAQRRIIHDACKDEDGCQQIMNLIESVVAQTAQCEDRFRQMFERNAAIKLLIDPADGRIVGANPAAAAFYGYDHDTLCRMRITDINVLTPAEVQAEMRRALAEERTFFDFRHRLASGEIRDVEVFSGPVDMPGKRYLYSIILDVTERKRAEAALRENEGLLCQITGNIRDIFFISDPVSQRILYISPQFEAFWGVSAEALKRDRNAWMDRLHPDEDRERLRRLVSFDDTPPDQMLAMLTRRKAECGDGPLLEYEYRMVRPDGDVRWIRVRSFAIENEAGEVYRVAGVGEDITEQKKMEVALRESETLLRQVTGNIRDVFFISDPISNRTLYISEAYEAVWGRDRAQIYEDRWSYLEAVHPDDRARIEAAMRHDIPPDQIVDALTRLKREHGDKPLIVNEYRIIRPDGEIRWIRGRNFGIEDEAGRVYRIAGIAEDITDQRRAEAALRESETRLRGLFDAVQESVFLIDPTGIILDMNNIAAQRLERNRQDLIGASAYEIFSTDLRDNYAHFLERVVREGQPTRFQHERDGTWFDTVSSPVMSEDNTVHAIAIVGRDITEHKQLTNALQTREEQLRQIIDQSVDGIVLTNSAGQIVVWNYGQERITGMPGSEALGQYVWDVQIRLYPDVEDRDEVYEHLRAMIQVALETHEAPWFYRYMDQAARRLDGEMRIMQTMAYPIDTNQGFMIGSVNRDVTEERQAQKTLHERELLQVALQKEQELNAFKREMMVRVAHEFRTPLSVIGTSSYMIERYLERMTPEQRQERVHHIQQQIDHLEHLLDELSIVVNGQDYDPGPFDLTALCRSLVETWDAQNPHDVTCEIQGHIPRLYGDERLIRRILTNVLSNAVKFSDPSKSVRLTLSSLGDQIQIKAIDQGIGIPAGEINAVFEPFVRGSNLDECPGMGLGLTKTREAVLLHGGRLDIDSSVGVGTTVTVTLPLTREM